MKTFVAGAFFALAFWALLASADATLDCSVGPIGNGVADTITGRITIRFHDGNGYSWNVVERSSGVAVTWSSSSQTSESSVSFDWSFVAVSPNESFQAVMLGGNTSDTCSLQITGITSHVVGTPLPQSVKDGAQRSKDNTDYWNGKLTYAGPILCGLWDAMCIVTPAVAIGMQYHSDKMAKYITDPPTDCYASNDLRIPDVGELGVDQHIPDLFGDGVVRDYTWGMLYWTTFLQGYGQYAYDELNSASACSQIGDSGMFTFHQNNARWATGQYAQNAANAAVHYRVLGNEFAAKFNPAFEFASPCDAANQQYYSERPDVAQSDYYGPSGPNGTNGAWQHYLDYGQYEGTPYHADFCPGSLGLADIMFGASDALNIAAQSLPW